MTAVSAPPIVGVGASAGGLAAFRELLHHLGSGDGAAVVLVQHLAPDHESRLTDLLGRHASMPVVTIRDGVLPEPDCVYVLPPEHFVTLQDGRLRLSAPDRPGSPRMVIDRFLRSLADERGGRAVGIVLSGTGTDGSAGLRAIRARGGLTIAQLPEDAGHDGMPKSAIRLGTADLVLPIAEIPPAIERFLGAVDADAAAGFGVADLDPDGDVDDAAAMPNDADLSRILNRLRESTAFDGALYKSSTVRRRVRRRMRLRESASAEEYLAMLHDDHQEAEQLLRDLLIGVTDFFRDAEVFDVFRERVAPELIEASADGRLRMWVPGCSTGEEAYSLAICLHEAADTAGQKIDLQIFATDIDRAALDIGRAGVYEAGSLRNVSAERRARFFSEDDHDRWRVSRQIRDCVSFAAHDALRDPPFSRLDVVSCRNLLIYLTREAQSRLLGLFQFALRRDGVLVLGTAERPPEGQSAFAPIDKPLRIYRRVGSHRPTGLRLPLAVDFTRATNGDPAQLTRSRRDASLADVASRVLLESCAVAGAVVDRHGTVLFLHGPVHRYLDLPRGEMRPDLFSMVRPELRGRVRAALYRAIRDRGEVSFQWSPPRPDEIGPVRVRVTPSTVRDADGLLALVFDTTGSPRPVLAPAEPTDEDASLVAHLERELEATREDLRSTLEELESSNEELRSSNEETMSMNEELQSSNEELEASTEELRSLNEELSTVNQQLREKVAEVQAAHDDLANVFKSTRVATLFLDSDLALVRFTPAAGALIGLGTTAAGNRIGALLHPLDPAFESDARRVLEDLRPAERELRHPDGRWFQRRILPYRTEEDRISGVVAVFTNVTSLKDTAEQLAARARRQAATTRLGLEALDRATTLDALLQRTTPLVAETLGVELVKLLQLLPGGTELRLVSGVGWGPGVVGVTTVPASAESQAGYTLRSTQPVVVHDLENDPRLSGPELLHIHRVRAGISCVVHGIDGPWGVIGAHTPRAVRFTEDDVLFVQGIANVLSSAVQRHQSTESLRDGERRLTLAKDAAAIGIHDYDIVTGHIHWDALVRDMWGIPPTEEIDLDVFLAGLHPDDRGPTIAGLERAKDPAGDGRYAAEYRVRARGARQYRWVYATGQVFFENHRPVRLVGTAQDVTARKRVEQSLLDQNRRLEREDRRKQEFLATLGHELRNPLAALDGAIRVLESGLRPAEEMSPLMAGHVRNLSRLVDDLLDLSRISSGRVRLREEPLDLRDAARAALDAVRLRAADKGQRVELHAPEPVPVHGDPTRLQQIVANLLVNACEYSDADASIDIRVTADGERARVDVEDEGRGLTAEQIESIFQPFAQVRPGGGGLGIGLPLVAGLAALHGGSVTATSPGLGLGSTFTLRLPLSAGAPPPAVEPREPAARRRAPLRILVVDDLRDAADMLTLLLRSSGAEARAAHGGARGIEEILEWRPHVALVDLGMPQVDGFAVALRVREQLGDDAPLLLAATGFGDSDTEVRVLESGFRARLLKPVDPDRLIEMVERLLGERDGTPAST